MTEQNEQNRSERATPFKLSKAREKGAVARGVDLGYLASLVTFIGFLWIEGSVVRARLGENSRRALVAAPDALTSAQAILTMTGRVFWLSLYTLMWLPAVMFCVILVVELIQTGPVFSVQAMRPDFSRLNPASGFKRVFSLRQMVETGKNVFKMALYGAIGSLTIFHAFKSASNVTDVYSLAGAMAGFGQRLLLFFAVAAAAFALLDQLIVRHDFAMRMRMTRRDVRRELRDREGDPRMKQRRKQLHRQFVKLSKSIRNIRDADVLITNPTHYAVALKYDSRTMGAPTIVSQATNDYAMRLRRLAFVYGVTVIQNPALAKNLYHRGGFEKQIPEVYFRSVAEVYIMMRSGLSKMGSRVV